MTFPYLKSLVSSEECIKHSKENIRMPISSKRYGWRGKEIWGTLRLTVLVDYRGKRRTLTVWVALAELLTEILSHDARAGAVTGAVWVVAGLVVVHLCGRVI